MGTTIQRGDLQQILGMMGGAAFLGAVATGSSTTVINANSALSTPAAGNYVGGILRFVTGALAGQEQPISANTASSFTVSSAFTAIPGNGDLFVVIQKIEVQVTAPENIAQVGGVAVPTDDAGYARVPVTEFRDEVYTATVAIGQVRFIASGDEAAYLNLIANGYERVNGGLYCNNLIIGADGKVVIGSGGSVQTGAFI